MSNRLNAPNLFASLSPPWLLSQLDSNSTQNQAAWNDSSLGFVNGVATDTGSTNAYVVTAVNLPFGVPSAYNPGMVIFINPANNNTGSSTIAVASLGTANILNPGGNALLGGEIIAGKRLGMIYSNVAPVGFYIIGDCCAISEFGTVGTNQSINAAGCMNVVGTVSFNANNLSLIFNNVPAGATLSALINNAGGSTANFGLQVSNSAGTQVPVYAVFATGGGTLQNINTAVGGLSFPVASGNAVIFNGKMGRNQATMSV